MNRRGFISLMLGAAGAPLVPWRGLVHPTIFLPDVDDEPLLYGFGATPDAYTFSNGLAVPVDLSLASIEEMLRKMMEFPPALTPDRQIMSPAEYHARYEYFGRVLR